MGKTLQILLAFMPLILMPALMVTVSEGILNLGGGDKDIFWVFVWTLWAVCFAICSLVLIFRDWTVKRWALRSGWLSLRVMLVLWLIVFVVSTLEG